MSKVSISAVSNQMLLDVYLKLLSCISFENIQDDNFVAKKILEIEDLEPWIAPEIFSLIMIYIKENIEPILNEPEYFDFTKNPDYGHNEDGIWKIDAEEGLNYAIASLIKHCSDLKKHLINWFKENLLEE